MKGKYMYEEGFTSTSILKDTSYFNKKSETGLNYNIQIKYLISKDCNDGALLLDPMMSYSVSQNEYLINCESLTKIIDVKIDKEQNQALLVGVLVPKKLWDLSPEMNQRKNFNRKTV